MANQKEAKSQPESGKELLSWTFPEFVKYRKTKAWYVCAALVMAGLLAYAVFTANFLFAVFIAMAVVVWLFQEKKDPLEMEFSVTEGGIKVNESFYRFDDLKNFWIAYEPPEVKSLYFDFKSVLKPRIFVDLQDQDPVKVREMLLEYLDEDLDKNEEPFSDHLRRKLKI